MLGVPLGTLVGQSVGWRGAFVMIAALGLIALAGITRTLQDIPSPGTASLRQRAAVAKIRGVPSTLLATALAMCGVFVLYIYLAWFFGRTGDVSGSTLTVIYLIAGIAAVASNFAAGWMIDHMPAIRVAAVSMAGIAVTSLGIVAVARSARPGAGAAIAISLLLAAWSLIGWLFNHPAQRQRLITAAGPRGPIALSLNSSAIYAGQALAGVLGGLALSGGPAILALAAAACVTAALVSLGVSHLRTTIPATPDRDDLQDSPDQPGQIAVSSRERSLAETGEQPSPTRAAPSSRLRPIAANNYCTQPLLPGLQEGFRVSSGLAGLCVILNQLGYTVGLIFLVPLGDLMRRRRLIVTLLGIDALTLAAAATAPSAWGWWSS